MVFKFILLCQKFLHILLLSRKKQRYKYDELIIFITCGFFMQSSSLCSLHGQLVDSRYQRGMIMFISLNLFNGKGGL